MNTFPGPIPETDDQLHAFIARWIGVTPSRAPILDLHSAPFDYLAHAFFEDRRPRDSIVWACRGGGKTFLAAVATALDMTFKPGIEVRCLGGSLEQSKRMHAHLRALFEKDGFSDTLAGKITERKIALTNGAVVEVLAQSQTSVRGTRVQKLRCDEVELFDPAVWEAAQLTTRSKECGPVRVVGAVEAFSTMHVPYGLMHDLVASAAPQGAAAGRRLFRWGVVDVLDTCPDDDHQCLTDRGPCPLAPECAGMAKARDRAGSPPGHITVSDAIALKQRVGLETWNAEMLCLRPKRSDCVLPEFNEAEHVVSRPPDASAAWPVVAGMDLGIRAPTVVLWARLAPDGRLCVFKEHARAGITLDEHINIIRATQPRPDWIGIDPAGRARTLQTGRSDAQTMRDRGLQVRDIRLPLFTGVELVRARLRPAHGPPRLTITRDCPDLIRCLSKYHYPADPENPTPEKDGHDHAPDALRYLIQNLDRPYQTRLDRYA